MSLQVWLPLNGNLNNQGLNGDAIISGTPSYGSSGKIGNGCLNTSNMISIYEPSIEDKKICSFAFWAYITGSSITSDWTLVARIRDKGTNSGSHLRFEVCPPSRYNGIYCFSNHNNGNYAITNGVITSKSGGYYDQWVHFCFTSDGTTLTRYMNGVKEGTCAYNGPGYFSGYFDLANNDKCFKQDVRIYDHCLSAKEVKEISKGLICHYKLDNKGFGSPNLLAKSSIVNRGCTSLSYDSTSNTWTGVAPTGSSNWGYGVTFSNSSNKISVPIGTTACFSLEVNPDVNCSCNADVNNATTDGSNPSGNDNDDTSKRTTNGYNLTANKWNKVYWTYTAKNYNLYDANSNWGIVTTNLSSPVNFKLRNIKVEHGTKPTTWCPHTSDSLYTSLGLNLAIEEDCSGLGNNGVIKNQSAISIEKDSPRYEVSTVFNGTPFIIGQNLNGAKSTDALSLCAWINPSQVSGGYNIVSSYESGGAGLHISSGNIYFQIYSGGYIGVSGGSVSANTWYHVVGTYDNSKLRIYINGELKGEVAKTGNITYNSNTPWAVAVNPSGTSDGGEHFYGKLSDVRIYSTALSAEDIKALYNTSVSVDKNGNMYAYEFKEE